MTNIYTDLPKIVRVTSVTDAGEFGAATCPHCGASGRYIYHFDCADGTHGGAMKGCFSKFPKHKFAAIHANILDKKRTKKYLASWDTQKLEAIEKFIAGELTEKQAQHLIDMAQSQCVAYVNKAYGRPGRR